MERGKKMNEEREVLKGTTAFLTEDAGIIEKEEIKSILPHRGTKLLLDQVLITAQKITGKFRVTKEVCQGHAVLNGKLVLKGSDLLDMAAQLLAVWMAQNSDFKENGAVIREYKGAKFRKPIFPGELLVLEMDKEDTLARVFREGKIITVTGERFLAKVKNEIRAEIYPVKLFIG